MAGKFTTASEVRLSQLQGIVSHKRASVEAEQREVDRATLAVGEGAGGLDAVKAAESNVDNYRIELRGAELLLDREKKRHADPKFQAALVEGDALAARIDDGAIKYESWFQENCGMRIRELAAQIVAIAKEAKDAAAEVRKPHVDAKMLQKRIALRAIDPDRTVFPMEMHVWALCTGALELGLEDGARAVGLADIDVQNLLHNNR